MTTIGYAVKQGGQIIVETVSPHERAAKANWLAVACGYRIRESHTDHEIEVWFETQSKRRRATLIAVEITEIARG
jgi:hypothetical protein